MNTKILFGTVFLWIFVDIIIIFQFSHAAKPLNLFSFQDQRVLMISAHPDDIETCVGGTIALLTAQGTQVFYVIVTNAISISKLSRTFDY